MKAIVTLLAAALTVTGCSNLTGPDDAAARAAAKRKLEVASKVPEPSMKLAAN
jgi:PBP1b-binding outer membrane lipoprotein LpoB